MRDLAARGLYFCAATIYGAWRRRATTTKDIDDSAMPQIAQMASRRILFHEEM